MLKHRARNLDQARVYPVGALTQGLKGERLTEMVELHDAGCVAFSQADAPIANLHVLMRAMQYAATFGFKVWMRPQDMYLANHGVAHDGEIATRLGLPAIPVCAETIALTDIVSLMRETGASVHLCRISSTEGVALVRAAKQQGLPLTCDVSIHHVHLTDMDIGFLMQTATLCRRSEVWRIETHCARGWQMARLMQFVRIMPQWMKTLNCCLSLRQKREQPGWSCCCRLR